MFAHTRTTGHHLHLRALGAAALLSFGAATTGAAPAQPTSLAVAALKGAHVLPFAVGERLTYTVRIPSAWMSGRGVMSVDSLADIRGTQTWVLHFEFKAKVGPVKASSDETSWLDPLRLTALQFQKRERSPLGKDDETVELFPAEKRWLTTDGKNGTSPSDAPLDELSFIYFVRTLPLAPDTTYTFDRHFDVARNPITVRVVRRDTLTTPAGPVATILVEMRVKDPRHYRGDGVISINLSDDAERVPMRIASTIPGIGTTIFTLESRTTAAPTAAPAAPAASRVSAPAATASPR